MKHKCKEMPDDNTWIEREYRDPCDCGCGYKGGYFWELSIAYFPGEGEMIDITYCPFCGVELQTEENINSLFDKIFTEDEKRELKTIITVSSLVNIKKYTIKMGKYLLLIGVNELEIEDEERKMIIDAIRDWYRDPKDNSPYIRECIEHVVKAKTVEIFGHEIDLEKIRSDYIDRFHSRLLNQNKKGEE